MIDYLQIYRWFQLSGLFFFFFLGIPSHAIVIFKIKKCKIIVLDFRVVIERTQYIIWSLFPILSSGKSFCCYCYYFPCVIKLLLFFYLSFGCQPHFGIHELHAFFNHHACVPVNLLLLEYRSISRFSPLLQYMLM